MSNESTTTVEDRVENFILAPSDPAWGDERNREEYYRAMTVGYYWVAPVSLLVALVAAAEGAKFTAVAVLWLVPITQLAAYRYCTRHHVPLAEIMRGFFTPKRRAVLAAILIPYVVLLCALIVDSDPLTFAGAMAGGLVGAAVAGIAALLAARQERRREAAAGDADDVFE